MRTLLFMLVTGWPSPASAGKKDTKSEACVRTKVWDGYSEGWGIRP